MILFRMESPSRDLQSVQVLRFVAAVLVVLFHVSGLLADWSVRLSFRYQLPELPAHAFDGLFGVQIFFVISGFIMAHVMWDRFGRPGAASEFFYNRVTRIAPLYWLATLLAVALDFISIKMSHARVIESFSAFNVLRSLLFIPYAAPITPILITGWTLNMEVIFYLLMMSVLTFSRRIAILILLVMLAIASIGLPRLLHGVSYAPMTGSAMIEFGGGVLLAIIRQSGYRMILPPLRLCAAIVCAVIIADLIMYEMGFGTLPGTAFSIILVGMAVLCGDISVRNPATAWLIRAGNASYSLYLIHMFILQLLNIAGYALASPRIPTLPVALVEMVLLGAAVSIVVASIAISGPCYRFIEKPITKWLRRDVIDRRIDRIHAGGL